MSLWLLAAKTAGGEADGVPSALVEALAFGLAVIASDLPGHAEAVKDGGNGVLCRRTTLEPWLMFWNTLPPRPDERKRLGDAARKSVFALADADRTEARLGELIKKACGKA